MARLISQATNEILNLKLGEIEDLSLKELKQAVRRVSSTANARLRGLEEKGYSGRSLAYKNVKEAKEGQQKVRFGVRGKDKDALINELTSARRFLKSKTSTPTGARNLEEKVAKHITQKTKEKMASIPEEKFTLSDKQWERFWDIYHEVEKNDSLQKYGSTELQERVMAEWVQDKRRGKDWVIKQLLEEEEALYESTLEEETQEEEAFNVWSQPPKEDIF